MEHPSVDQVVQEVNDHVMQSIRRTVDPLVYLVKDANEKYATLERVLTGLPCFSELQAERENLRARLEKLESNVTLTVEDKTNPSISVSPASESAGEDAWDDLFRFLEQSIDGESDAGAQRAFRTVMEYTSKEQAGEPSLQLFWGGDSCQGADEGLSSVQSVTQSVSTTVDRLLEAGLADELEAQSAAESPTSEADADQNRSAASPQHASSELYHSSDEDEGLVPYDAGLVDEFDEPIPTFVDDLENGSLYEKVGESYEEIGCFRAGTLEIHE